MIHVYLQLVLAYRIHT
jgi:hypothetical protein